VFDCSDPGTGKTAVRIWAAERRIKRRQVRKVLVLAPKSLLRTVWEADIRKFAPALRTSVSVAGKHETAFAADADVYITNIDAVKWLAKQPKSFWLQFDEIIIDESSAYKHHTSQRSKAVGKLATKFKFRSCLTGTPNSNTITDVWHQVKILDDGKRLGGSFYAFRNAVCTPTQVGNHEKAIRWEDKDGAEETVFGLLSDIVIRHKFEDCVDIPENHKYTVPHQMPAPLRRVYDQMAEHAIAEIYGTTFEQAKAALQGKKLKPKGHITAVHAAAARMKLLQIASGAVYSASGKYELLDTSRYELVLDLAEQAHHSLAFFLWQHQRDLLAKEADKRGLSFAVIDGGTKEQERADIVKRYQAGAYRLVLAHPQSAAHGLTLTKGTRTIWASPTDNLEWFVQGSKRQYRIGQTQKTETITVVEESTIEHKVYHETLAGKAMRMDNLLDLFASTK
jgi:SNF2 family DNA or RNA helicase